MAQIGMAFLNKIILTPNWGIAKKSSNRAESRTRASPNLPNFVDKHGMHAVCMSVTNGRILLDMIFCKKLSDTSVVLLQEIVGILSFPTKCVSL